ADAWSAPNGKLQKTFFDAYGTSYKYNENPWNETQRPLADPVYGLAGKPESWIPEPTRHILINEIPALPALLPDGFVFHQWHYPSGSVTTRDLKNLSKKAVSPLLFIDGHVTRFNLKRHFQSTAPWIGEPTPDRIWYKSVKD